MFGGLFDPAYLLVTAALFRVLETSGAFVDALKLIGLMALMLAARIAWSQLYNTVLKPMLCENLHARGAAGAVRQVDADGTGAL